MAIWKLVINDVETRKSYQVEVEQTKAIGLIGKKIGEEITGDIFGLNGYTLKITGGTDKDGFPMHPSVRGPGRKKVLLAGPPGFHPKIKGQRKRKTVCGDTISDSIVQINAKVVKKGEKPITEMLGKDKEKDKEKEKKTEEKHKEEKEEVTPEKPEQEEGEKTNQEKK
jgi:small subunit ribosomal protein S6e